MRRNRIQGDETGEQCDCFFGKDLLDGGKVIFMDFN